MTSFPVMFVCFVYQTPNYLCLSFHGQQITSVFVHSCHSLTCHFYALRTTSLRSYTLDIRTYKITHYFYLCISCTLVSTLIYHTMQICWHIIPGLRSSMCYAFLQLYSYLGAYLGKGTYWQFLHEFDCRETTLSNAANHLKKFLIEFEICLYEHLYFLYIRNPLFPIVVFVSLLWQLKVNMFYPKYSFPIV